MHTLGSQTSKVVHSVQFFSLTVEKDRFEFNT